MAGSRSAPVLLLLGALACGGAPGQPGASGPRPAGAESGSAARAALPVCADGVVAADPRLATQGLLAPLPSTLVDEGWIPAVTAVVEPELPAVLANAPQVERLLAEVQRRDLLDRRLTGGAQLLVLVDADGAVVHRRLERPSPQGPINVAAAEVVEGMVFLPAVHDGCRLPWVTLLPISFTLGG